jgi:hypothetical protein
MQMLNFYLTIQALLGDKEHSGTTRSHSEHGSETLLR